MVAMTPSFDSDFFLFLFLSFSSGSDDDFRAAFFELLSFFFSGDSDLGKRKRTLRYFIVGKLKSGIL